MVISPFGIFASLLLFYAIPNEEMKGQSFGWFYIQIEMQLTRRLKILILGLSHPESRRLSRLWHQSNKCWQTGQRERQPNLIQTEWKWIERRLAVLLLLHTE